MKKFVSAPTSSEDEDVGPRSTASSSSEVASSPSGGDLLKERRRDIEHQRNSDNVMQEDGFSFSSLVSTRRGLALCGIFVAHNALVLSALAFSVRRSHVRVSWCGGVGFLLAITMAAYSALLYHLVLKRVRWRAKDWALLRTVEELKADDRARRWIPMTTVFLLASSALAFSAVDSSGNRSRLLPFLALLVIVAVATLVSASPRSIRWRTPTFCLSLAFALCLCWDRSPAFRHGLSCLADKARWVSASALGEGAARAAVGRMGMADGWRRNGSQEIQETMSLETSNSTAAFSSDWLTWTPPSLPPNSSSSSLPFLPATLSLGALSSLYAAGAAAAAMAHMGVTPWAVRSVGGTMRLIFDCSSLEGSFAVLLLLGLGPAEAALFLRRQLASASAAEMAAVVALAASRTGATCSNNAFFSQHFGIDLHLLDLSVLASVLSVLAMAKVVNPPLPEVEVELPRRTKRSAAEEGNHSSLLEEILGSVSLTTSLALTCLGLCLTLSGACLALDLLLRRGVGAMFELAALTPASAAGAALRPIAFLVGADRWDRSDQVSQVLATRLFYSSPASASRLASYFPSSSSTSPRAASLAVASGAVDGLGPVGLGVSLGIVAALMPQEKLRKLCRDSPGFLLWRAPLSALLGSLASGAVAGMVFQVDQSLD